MANQWRDQGGESERSVLQGKFPTRYEIPLTPHFLRQTGPAVLHGLTFSIRAGERVGVVGRTGSGKVGYLILTCQGGGTNTATEFSYTRTP